MPIDATQPIAVTLLAGQWNSVLACLAEAPLPWKLVNPLITAIQQQCMDAGQPEDGYAKMQNVVPLPQTGE